MRGAIQVVTDDNLKGRNRGASVGRTPRKFALTPSIRPFGKAIQTASLPYIFLKSWRTNLCVGTYLIRAFRGIILRSAGPRNR